MVCMVVAGAVDTVLGNPPSSAVVKLPGVWTDSVGVPLALACLEMKIISCTLGKCWGRVWAFVVSSFRVMSCVGLWLISAW